MNTNKPAVGRVYMPMGGIQFDDGCGGNFGRWRRLFSLVFIRVHWWLCCIVMAICWNPPHKHLTRPSELNFIGTEHVLLLADMGSPALRFMKTMLCPSLANIL